MLTPGFLRWLADAFRVLYPNQCPACYKDLSDPKLTFCLNCHHALIETKQFLNPSNNSFLQKLQFYANFHQAIAFYEYHPKTSISKLIHAFKYHQKPAIATQLGIIVGTLIANQPKGVLVPIPLHPKRLNFRGYNQSAYFAHGLNHSLGWGVDENLVLRQKNTTTQTRQSLSNRWSNMQDAFILARKTNLPTTVYLVDDVVTTGSTVVHASRVLSNQGVTSISVIALAVPPSNPY